MNKIVWFFYQLNKKSPGKKYIDNQMQYGLTDHKQNIFLCWNYIDYKI